MASHPIGIFDSGYGGLTVFREIAKALPHYDYLYLGDNARAPYGNRSFETVYQYTWQCVQWFHAQGCPLVILACNTASAKALRSIQQRNLPQMGDNAFRVLGVIRPTAEVIGKYSRSRQVGILATSGTVNSESYVIEIEKQYPDIEVYQEACPMWVPLIENNEHLGEGADYFVEKHVKQLMAKHPAIDTVLLACTHYPLLQSKIESHLPVDVSVISQGPIVAHALQDYLLRHPDMEQRISRAATRVFYTTDDASDFENHASIFYGENVKAQHVELNS
jgi:glutamate racemase